MDIEGYKQTYGKGWLRRWKHDKIDTIRTSKNNSKRRKKNDWDYYSADVRQLTNDNKHHIPNIHKRGFLTYHIDHKISVKYGYDNGILAENIAHPTNMEMLKRQDNIRKSTQCKIDDNNQWIMDTLSE